MANKHTNDVAPMTLQENSAMVHMALKVFSYTDIDLRDQKQVENRIMDYFGQCDSLGLRPGNMGLYSALGLSRQEVHNIITGRDKNKVSRDSCDTIKRAIRALSTYREMLGSSGKINPVTLIFWQKNFDSLRDSAQIELTTNPNDMYNNDYLQLSQEELQKRIPIYNTSASAAYKEIECMEDSGNDDNIYEENQLNSNNDE